VLVIPDCRESGKSGIHIHRPANMDSGLAPLARPGMTLRHSILMPARSITSPHFLDSMEISVPNSCGEPPATSSPI
jgi:hypothetical protein